MMNSKLFRRFARHSCTLLVASSALAGCASMGSSGPTAGQVLKANRQTIESSGIKVIDLTDRVAREVSNFNRPALFSEQLGDGYPAETVIGPGDVIDISIIEAPPAVLFSSAISDVPGMGSVRANTASRQVGLPQQMVDLDGRVSVPFAGSVQAAGRTPQQIEGDIARRLRGKAHDPQVSVRRVTNATSTVTVLGDVAESGRVPLTAKGERLLDVIAAAGGAKHEISKSVVQITRGNRTLSLPFATVVNDGRQNVRLGPNDVVTVLYQPYSFSVLGATGTNAEIPLEGDGIALSQALGRVGGLQDNRANVRGVFIFRLEDPGALGPQQLLGVRTTADGKIPVIYRIDLTNPGTFLVAQTFPIKNKDVLYVANAPLTDFSKFVNIISSMTFTIFNLGNSVIR